MSRFIDNSGQRFGSLTAIRFTRREDGKTYWLFKCDCGVEKELSVGDVRFGKVLSCGCRRQAVSRERLRLLSTQHGHSKHPLYKSHYVPMIKRCYVLSNKDYQNYGGRGIIVCEEWLDSFEQFCQDMGDCPSGFTIERKDSDGNYEPGNCIWASRADQYKNRRTPRTVKLNSDDVIRIRELRNTGVKLKTVAQQFKVSEATISKIARNISWRKENVR